MKRKILFHYSESKYPKISVEEDYWKLVVAKQDRTAIIHKNHDQPTSEHTGVLKTYDRIAQRYFWPKMRCDIAKCIRRCSVCAAVKPEPKVPAGTIEGK